MQLVISREALSRGLARVQGVINRKATLPVLSNALLEASVDGFLRIAATDLDVTFDGRLPARVVQPGRITVDGRRLYEIARNLPGEEVSISVDEDLRIVLRCKTSEFVLLGASAEGYPALPSAGGVGLHRIDGTAFRSLIERTQFSVSTEESRPALNGVFLHCIGAGRVRMVSTDGHRLSLAERNLGPDSNLGERDGVIVPRKGIGEIRRLLDEVGNEVEFGFLQNNLVMRSGDLLLFVRLIDAAFPDYNLVIPRSSERRVSVERSVFFSAIKRIAILASERTHGMRLELSKTKLTLVSDNPDLGKAREELEVQGFTGSDLIIAFNSKYVMEILSVLTAERVVLLLNEALSPGLIREEANDDDLFVVMPMRL